jgi:antitoxin VapB
MYYLFIMATTRVFKSGNSLAIRMPAEIAYEEGTELTITRSGDMVTVVPKKQDLKAMVEALRALPSVPIEEREPIELPDRDWD